jgi:ATP-dependent Clp protease ATP-binding subunit ClpA
LGDRYERFTEHALLALMLAEEEARRLNHTYAGTEHLLLGLVREGVGVGARMLASLGVELADVRAAVESIIGQGEPAVSSEITFTPRAMKVLSFAQEEAHRLHHNMVGTEHLLLGLAREGEGIAAAVLESLGVNLERVRVQMTRLLLQRSPPGAMGKGPPDRTHTVGTLRRSMEAIQRENDAAIAMQDYERIAYLRAREAALQAEINRLELESDTTPDLQVAAWDLSAAPADPLMLRHLGRAFRDAFDLGLALSPEARVLLEAARGQAELLGQTLIGPEHMLLALTLPESALAREIERRGTDLRQLRSEVESIIGDALSRDDTWAFEHARENGGL